MSQKKQISEHFKQNQIANFAETVYQCHTLSQHKLQKLTHIGIRFFIGNSSGFN